MSDKLSQFISGLKTLDPSNLGAPANREALAKFQGMNNSDQRAVLNDLAGRYGSSFDELASFPPETQNAIAKNIEAGRDPFAGIERRAAQPPAPQAPAPAPQPAQPPATFEGRWLAAAEAARAEGRAHHPLEDSTFRARHGDEAARVRHGYQSPERAAQLERIASIQAEAKASGKTFSEVADARVASGQ